MAAFIEGINADNLVWILVLVMIIEGVWLTGLTYLLWRRAKERAEASEDEEPSEEPTTST
jgi:uncharacterized oligopeptide transporter (OPT) family protein